MKKITVHKLWSTLTIPAILVILIWASVNINSKKDYSKGIIEADGKGYYAYLPAIFIYKDLNFGFFDRIENVEYQNKNLYYNYRYTVEGHVIDKYYAGTALCMSPFFLIGHVITLLSGYPADGYSRYYTLMVNLGAIFYLALSLVFIRKLLLTFNIRISYISMTLLALVFGTNLFYYTVIEFSMSHIYSFAFITIFLYLSKVFFTTYKVRLIVLLGAVLGIIALIRPVNLLILFIIPFIAGNPSNLVGGLKKTIKNYIPLIFSVLLFLLVFGIQFMIYKIQTSHFWVYSYGSESFNFLKPHILKILFSYKKGLFIYTPLLFISLAGGYYLYKTSKYQFVTMFAFLFLITYIFSSWWMWYYGGSFSSRVFIEYYALFAILLALTLENLPSGNWKRIYLSLVFLLVLICQIQTYQYRYYFIHWSEMNKEKYWEVFLRVDQLIKK
jgi:hypothetical protein